MDQVNFVVASDTCLRLWLGFVCAFVRGFVHGLVCGFVYVEFVDFLAKPDFLGEKVCPNRQVGYYYTHEKGKSFSSIY